MMASLRLLLVGAAALVVGCGADEYVDEEYDAGEHAGPALFATARPANLPKCHDRLAILVLSVGPLSAAR